MKITRNHAMIALFAVCAGALALDAMIERPAPPETPGWTHFGLGDWLIQTDNAQGVAEAAKGEVEELSGCEVVEVLISPAETFVMASTNCSG